MSVATIDQPDLPRQETDNQVDVHRFRQLRSLLPSLGRAQRQRHHPPFADPITTSGLRRLVRGFEPDVVHSYGWISFSCARALRRTDIPLIISARDYAYSCQTRIMMRRSEPCGGPDLGKCLACASRHYGVVKGVAAVGGVRAHHRSLRKRVRGVHSISSYVRDITRRDFLGADDPSDIDGVAEMVIPSFREQMYPPEDDVESYLEKLPAEPSILFVGALRRVKGIVELLAAYESLVDPPPLVLIGTLERDTPRELPGGVHIVGDFPHDAVLAAMDRSLFAVFPSLWPEPFGSVVHEAMSRGLAVIGTKPGGHEDMIDDDETGRSYRAAMSALWQTR